MANHFRSAHLVSPLPNGCLDREKNKNSAFYIKRCQSVMAIGLRVGFSKKKPHVVGRRLGDRIRSFGLGRKGYLHELLLWSSPISAAALYFHRLYLCPPLRIAPVNDHLDILLPLKGAAQFLFKIGIGPPYDDCHHPGPFFRRRSCFCDPQEKLWQLAHHDLLVSEQAKLAFNRI